MITLILFALLQTSLAILPDSLPCGFQVKEIIKGIGSPVDFCPIDDDRSLLLTKSGKVLVLSTSSPGSPWNLPVALDISSRVNSDGELGLLGCAIDPQFTSSRPYVYLTYTFRNTTYNTPWGTQVATQRVSRFTWTGSSLNPASEQILFGSCSSKGDCLPNYRNFHAGAALAFGPDGYLYYAKGDGQLYEGVATPEYVPQPNWVGPQEITDPNGKLFRLDLNGKGIPSNPFYDGDANSIQSRVYAYGFRNPWSITFDLKNPSTVLVHQVGWFSREGVIAAQPGTNGGWPCFEMEIQAPQPQPIPLNPFCSTSTIIPTTSTKFSTITQTSLVTTTINNIKRTSTLSIYSTQTILQPTQSIQYQLHPRYSNYQPNRDVLFSYQTANQGSGCIIGAGHFPSQFPTWWNNKLFGADFVRGYLWWWDPSISKSSQTPTIWARNALQVVKMKPSNNGRLWLLQYDNGGSIREVWYDDGGSCPVPPGYTRTTTKPPSTTIKPTTSNLPPVTTTNILPTTTINGKPGPNGMIYSCNPNSLYPLSLTPLSPGLDTQMHVSDSGLFTCNQNSLGPCEFDSNNGGIARGDGSPLTLGTKRFQKGLSGRLPYVATINVNNMCTKFDAVIGIDDVTKGQGFGEFIIRDSDTKKILYNSTTLHGVITPKNSPKSLSVNIFGVKKLQLSVDRPYGYATQSNVNSIIDWADAFLWCGPDSRFVPQVKLWPTTSPTGGALPGGLKVMNLTGQQVYFQGSAQDYTGAYLPPSSLSWSADVVHCQGALCHVHPGMFTWSGTDRISFGGVAHQDCIWWKVVLQARDSCGRSSYATYQIRIAQAEQHCYTGIKGGFSSAKAKSLAPSLGISTQSLNKLALGKATLDTIEKESH